MQNMHDLLILHSVIPRKNPYVFFIFYWPPMYPAYPPGILTNIPNWSTPSVHLSVTFYVVSINDKTK